MSLLCLAKARKICHEMKKSMITGFLSVMVCKEDMGKSAVFDWLEITSLHHQRLDLFIDRYFDDFEFRQNVQIKSFFKSTNPIYDDVNFTQSRGSLVRQEHRHHQRSFI